MHLPGPKADRWSALCRRLRQALACAAAFAPAWVAGASLPDPSLPSPKRGNATFFQMHASFLARGKQGPIGLLFLGDSITEHWSQAPEIWKAHYARYAPANFGIAGDATQHVIWRIEHGELDGIHPSVVVLLIGTNNAPHYSAGQIIAADTKIVRLIQEKIPGVKVLLLGIFPRGPHQNPNGTSDDGVHSMEVIRATNAGLAQLDDGVSVRFLDLGSRFLGPDGRVSPALMPENLHPNLAGYQVWAEAMEPLLDEMLGAGKALPSPFAERIRQNHSNLPAPAEEETPEGSSR